MAMGLSKDSEAVFGENEYRALALQAQTDNGVHLAMHRRLMMLLSSASSLPLVRVRVYHNLFGKYGDDMNAKQLPDPYGNLFFYRDAIWELSEAPAYRDEGLPTVQYVCAEDEVMLRLLCEPELPSLVFGG